MANNKIIDFFAERGVVLFDAAFDAAMGTALHAAGHIMHFSRIEAEAGVSQTNE